MKHVSDEVWVDFVRGLLPSAERERIQRHVDAGCEQCAKSCQIWRSITDMAGREAKYQPPASAVRLAEAMFAETGRFRLASEHGGIAQLVFDSFLNPALAGAGVRSAMPKARNLVYQFGPYTIDLQVEVEGERLLSIAGQISIPGNELAEALEVEVRVKQRDRTLFQVPANQHGEFQFEIGNDSGLSFELDVSGAQPMSILLPAPLD